MANESVSTERCFEVERRSTEELVGLAAARGYIVFRGLSGRTLYELLKIATAGGRWEGRLEVNAMSAYEAQKA